MEVSGLTRQETIALTGVSSGKLSYLDSSGVIRPTKIGESSHPCVLYTWEQVVQIKLVEKIRSLFPLKFIPLILEVVQPYIEKGNLFDGEMFFIDNRPYIFDSWEGFGKKILAVSAKNKGKVAVIKIDFIKEIFEELQKNKEKVMDYDKRIKGTLLDRDKLCSSIHNSER